jgi:hypothetical protein
VLLHLDASGTVVDGLRLPGVGQLASIGDKLYVAANVDTPISDPTGTIMYTPMGIDVLVAELGPGGINRIVGAIGGAGDQNLWSLAAIAGDALALGARSTGQLVFGSDTSNSGTTQIDIVVALGL